MPQPTAGRYRAVFISPHLDDAIFSLKAGGLGLNLTAAEYVFLLDPWWNPAVEMQAIDRSHRIGQTRTVFAYRLKAVKVVTGGIHPNVLPDEALEHADTVVVGEAEGIWPQLVSDAASEQMQRLNRAGKNGRSQRYTETTARSLPGTKCKGVVG